MLTRIDLCGRVAAEADLPRPRVAGDPPVAAVQAIVAQVRAGGDAALRELTARFDRLEPGVDLKPLRVPSEAGRAALDALAPELREAMEIARANIEAYHR